MMEGPELAAYIKNHYGTCSAGQCLCRMRVWRGIQCPSWKPFNAKNWDELREVQKSFKAKVE